MIQGSIVQTCVVLATLNLVPSLFHSNIYWFQFVRDELLVAVDWANHLII